MAIPWGQIISAASQVAGQTAAGRAAGRQAETVLNNQRDALSGSQYSTAQQALMNAGTLDLQRQQFMENSRGGRAKQALIGSLLQNLQDVNISVPGIKTAQVSGGLRPSALGAGGKAAAGELEKQALLKMLQGDEFTGGDILPMPGLTPMPQAGKLDSILGALGTFGSMAGAIGQAYQGANASADEGRALVDRVRDQTGRNIKIDVNDLFRQTQPGQLAELAPLVQGQMATNYNPDIFRGVRF